MSSSARNSDLQHRSRVAAAIPARMGLAQSLFDELFRISADRGGITRAPYGETESAAHGLVGKAGHSLGLAVRTDHAGNTYVTLAGRTPELGPVIMGSHLDSVMCGGNYDGAAGVVAGLVVLAAMLDAGWRPESDVTVMGIRAEEGDWFGLNHIGTRGALGLVTAQDLEAVRADTGWSLAQHMTDAGCDLEAIRAGKRSLSPAAIKAYFELHIEQGPVLENADIPVGIVSGVRGSVRAHAARCLGSYAHSGAVPMSMRQDAVMAVADLVHALRDEWKAVDASSGDLVLTFGKLYTDPAIHQLSKVPGQVSFTIDARSIDPSTLDHMAAVIPQHAARIGQSTGVRFDLGRLARVPPARMDAALVEDLGRRAEVLGIPARVMASGAGHDAVDFANAGVPSAMVFVRNEHGSHNPAEAMALEDFCLGTQLLADAVVAASEERGRGGDGRPLRQAGSRRV